MRILASIILLLLLVGVRAGDGPAYPDTCDYTERDRGMCGDLCIRGYDYCFCGPKTDGFRPWVSDEHCCLEPGETCTIIDRYQDVNCSEGREVSMSSACNTMTGPHNSVAHLIADWGWESDYIQQLQLKASKTFTSSNC